MFDRDDNGYITRDELRTALEIIGEPVTDEQLNQVLALGDIDHDGRIDYEGRFFLTFVRRRLKSLRR